MKKLTIGGRASGPPFLTILLLLSGCGSVDLGKSLAVIDRVATVVSKAAEAACDFLEPDDCASVIVSVRASRLAVDSARAAVDAGEPAAEDAIQSARLTTEIAVRSLINARRKR